MQTSEDRGQRSEVGAYADSPPNEPSGQNRNVQINGQCSTVNCQFAISAEGGRSEVRDQKSEVRSQRSEVGAYADSPPNEFFGQNRNVQINGQCSTVNCQFAISAEGGRSERMPILFQMSSSDRTGTCKSTVNAQRSIVNC